MNTLMSYGITQRALQLLLNTEELPTEIPSCWFNWQYIQKTDIGNSTVNRLHLLNVDENGNEVESWERNALKLGYATSLIYSIEDVTEHTTGLNCLSDDLELIPVSNLPQEFEQKVLKRTREQLQYPEQFFHEVWSSLMGGGALSVEHFGFDSVLTVSNTAAVKVSVSQWFAYGQGLQKWITCSRGKVEKSHDYSVWNVWKSIDIQVPDIKLNMKLFFNRDRHFTVEAIPMLESANIVAYFPLRTLPCSGVAIDSDGKLHTIGALLTESDGSWAFDDGSIRQVFEQKAQELLATT